MGQSVGEIMSTSEAAATLTVGVDAFRNERKRTSSRLRSLTGLSIVGSAVINDTEVDMFIEDFYVGRFRVTRVGVVQAIYPDDVQSVREAAIPPGSALTATIVDAPATNALLIKCYGRQF